MTNEERIKAFRMRISGKTWKQIGAALHYDPWCVSKDLQGCLENPPRPPQIIYPAIHEFIKRQHSGSIEAFANSMGVSPYRLRRVLIHGDTPSDNLRKKILTKTGLPAEEAFLHVHM